MITTRNAPYAFRLPEQMRHYRRRARLDARCRLAPATGGLPESRTQRKRPSLPTQRGDVKSVTTEHSERDAICHGSHSLTESNARQARSDDLPAQYCAPTLLPSCLEASAQPTPPSERQARLRLSTALLDASCPPILPAHRILTRGRRSLTRQETGRSLCPSPRRGRLSSQSRCQLRGSALRIAHRSIQRRRAGTRLLADALKVRAAVYDGLSRFSVLAQPGDLAVGSTGFCCCRGRVFETVDNRIVANGDGSRRILDETRSRAAA